MALREVEVIISNIKTGDNYQARSYPDDDYDNNGKIELYNVPVYKIYISGKDNKNIPVRKEWKCLRFMPYWNDPAQPDKTYKTKGWVNSGKHFVAKKAVTYYNPRYGTHNRYSPYAGAIQIDKSFLVHAGPNNLAESGWGSAGCVEIIGNFDNFKKEIHLLSGSAKIDTHDVLLELVANKKLFIQVDYASPPNLKSLFAYEL